MAGPQSVHTVYQSVVDDVINGVREAFLDEGMDEQVLQELKQLWDSKLMQSKAIEAAPATVPQQQVPAAAMGSSQHQQQFSSYPGANRIATQQHPHAIPAAHSNSLTLAVTENPPLAHQNSQLQAQPLNLQGHVQMIGTSMSTAAQQGLISYRNNQIASAQSRITLPDGRHINISNDQVLQILSGQMSGQGAGSIILAAAKPDQKSDSQQSAVVQLDGVGDSSSDDDDDDNDADDADEDDDANDDNDEAGTEEEPLNSEDDVSDADPTEVFDAENVVVCQFDKINRCKNKWKFHLKDGIMNLNGKDYIFQKCTGDAEW